MFVAAQMLQKGKEVILGEDFLDKTKFMKNIRIFLKICYTFHMNLTRQFSFHKMEQKVNDLYICRRVTTYNLHP